MRIVALVPAYNEAERIGSTLSALATISEVNSIVVIDDGSTDHTYEVATSSGVAVVVQLENNQGKGQALNVGWKMFPADIYLLVDADLQDSALHVGHLLEPVVKGEVDMSIAHITGKQAADSRKMGFGIAKTIASWGIKRLTGHQLSSPLCGQRAVRNEVIEQCGGFASGFAVEMALTIAALKRGYRLMEISLPITHRATGRGLSGFVHRGKQLLKILEVLVRYSRRR